MFIPLHAKSDYSLGYATASVEALVNRAVELGYPALALTDLESLGGQVRFHSACRERGLRAITGIELRPGFNGRKEVGSRAGRLVLLARNETGYRNLCRIVSRRRGAVATEGDDGRVGADPLPLVAAHADGLFALSDDPSVVSRLLATQSFPRARLGMLLVRPEAETMDRRRVETARQLDIPLVADIDVVFLDEADHARHVLQLAIRQGRRMDAAARDQACEAGDRYLRSPGEAARLFGDVPDAMRAAETIGSACTFDLTSLRADRPALDDVTEEQAAVRLRKRCNEAFLERRAATPCWTEAYGERLEQELNMFERLGFSGFFLVIDEILGYCRRHAIPVLLRGSAASSLTLHLLGASPIDPLAHGLIFERFLHEGKSSWPDVDLDLPWHRRDEVIQWVYERFGRDRVAMVGAYHTFQRRSAVREGLKASGASQGVVQAMLGALPPDDLDSIEMDFMGQGQADGQDNKLCGHGGTVFPGGTGGEQMQLIRGLIDRPHHLAAHPGGLVISRGNLDEMLPLDVAAKGVVITQYDMEAVARLGLIKLDLLGNRCLSELEETLRLYGGSKAPRLDDIPLNDGPTLSLVDRADTIGCFQLESPAMRSLLARLPIRSHHDIIAALALIRPGAAAGRAKSAFVRRAHGEEPDPVDEPLLADRLAETHGLLLYEEDLILLLSRAGGISLAVADELRAAIVWSGGDREVLARLESGFMERARSSSAGDDQTELAGRGWEAALRFAAYSFNKAHAVSYAYLAYLSAYMKVHFPIEFACALLNHHQGIYPLRTLAGEFKRMDVELYLPHVNASRYESHVEHGAVRVGLDKIKVLSRRTAGKLLRDRSLRGPFLTVSDLLERLSPSAPEATALVLSGACDGLAPLTTDAYPFLHEAVVQRVREGMAPGEVAKAHTPPKDKTADQEARLRLYQGLVRVRNELRYLEMHLTSHPVALLRSEASRYGCTSVASARAAGEGSKVRLAVTIAALRRVPAATGLMQFLTVEDETGLLEAAVMSPTYARLGERVTTPGPFLIEGKVRREYDAVFLEVTEILPFHKRQGAFGV